MVRLTLAEEENLELIIRSFGVWGPLQTTLEPTTSHQAEDRHYAQNQCRWLRNRVRHGIDNELTSKPCIHCGEPELRDLW